MPRNKGWFRVYDRMMDSPDILELSDTEFRVVISLWCLASQGGTEDGKITYRNGALWRRVAPQIPREDFEAILTRLQEVGLILGRDGEYFVKDWARHQYLYDSKKPSVRERNGKSSGSVREDIGKSSGSFGEALGKQDTDTDTDTEYINKESKGIKVDPKYRPLLDLLHDMPIEAFPDDATALKALARWGMLCPHVDIPYELMRMQAWLVRQPKGKYKDFQRFALNWLKRAEADAVSKLPKEEPAMPEFQVVGEWQ